MGKNATVTASNNSPVRLRKTASSSADILAQVQQGTVVEVLENGDTWSKIKYNNLTGYMMTKFLQEKKQLPLNELKQQLQTVLKLLDELEEQ